MYKNTKIKSVKSGYIRNVSKKVLVRNIQLFTNKRAQRALGRSPEENVKGHSGAIYRGPLILSTKYW